MNGFMAAFFASFLGFFMHLILIAFGVVRINPDWCIRKLKMHAQILMVIWAAFLLIFFRNFSFFNHFNIFYAAELNQNTVFSWFYGISFFLMFFFVYLTFYYVVDRSVSSRLMIEIDNSPGQRLTFEEIIKIYDPDKKYENELKGMVEGGFIKKEGDYYFNTFKGKIVAVCTAGYKKIFRLGKGG